MTEPPLKTTEDVRQYLENIGVDVQQLAPLATGSSQARVYRLDAPLSTLSGLGITDPAILAGLTPEGTDSDAVASIALKVAKPRDRGWLAFEAKVLHGLTGQNQATYTPRPLNINSPNTQLSVLPLQYVHGKAAYSLVFPDNLEGNNADPVAAPERLTDFAVALWDCVRDLHRRQVAHRDLRLTNIMIVEAGKDLVWDKPVIIDFGRALQPFAPLFDTDNTPVQGSTVNTQGWLVPRRQLDPEQCSFDTEQAVDIYMWACNVYMAFTRQPLLPLAKEFEWERTTDPEKIEELSNEITGKLARLPERLRQPLALALQHNPNDRDADIINQHLHPISALQTPPPTKENGGNRAAYLTASIAVFLIVASIAAYLLNRPNSQTVASQNPDEATTDTTNPGPPTTNQTAPNDTEPTDDAEPTTDASLDPPCTILLAELPWVEITDLQDVRLNEDERIPTQGQCDGFRFTAGHKPEQGAEDPKTFEKWSDVPIAACVGPAETTTEGIEVRLTTESGDTAIFEPGPNPEGYNLTDDGKTKQLFFNNEKFESITMTANENANAGSSGGWIASCGRAGASFHMNYLP